MPRQLIYLLSATLLSVASVAAPQPLAPHYQSAFMRVELAPDQPAFTVLALDSLGKRKLSVNPLNPPASLQTGYTLREVGTTFEYRAAGASGTAPAAWAFEFSPRRICLRSRFAGGSAPPPFELSFNPYFNHATLLGNINPDSSVPLPALLHLPDLGTLRISSPTRGVSPLGYAGHRIDKGEISSLKPHQVPVTGYVRVTFAGATAALPEIEYDLDVVAIYPDVPGIATDPRFDGFRRNWLNIFQLSPHDRALSNHATSGPCPCTVYEYASVAERTPQLAPGVTAFDMVRQTLDRYLDGLKGIGMEGYDNMSTHGFMDSYPSALIAAGDYARETKDHAWLEKNYPGLRHWAAQMLAMDANGDGLLEYSQSGNFNSWPEERLLRPSNWWDTIGFGYQDAYANALAYRALLNMAELARQAGQPDDATMYAARAEKIRSIYFQTFYNPNTGVLAGWKSADGELHDYYFTFVNGIAISYGLVPHDKANSIMDRLLAKMKEVGYTHFEYGLPGNLIPVRRGDYVVHITRFGSPTHDDPNAGFQQYENGGATGSFVYYTLKALYSLGRRKDGDAILFPLLSAYEKGGFQGWGANKLTYDWKSWDGTPYGYEGMLVDNYQAVLAVLER